MVRHRILIPASPGSNPGSPVKWNSPQNSIDCSGKFPDKKFYRVSAGFLLHSNLIFTEILSGSSLEKEKSMEKKLIIFTDSGDTIVDEGTQQFDETGIVLRAELIPGAKETLKQLEEEGYRIALVADGVWESFQNVFRQHQLSEYFEAWVVSERVGCEKPESEMFLTAMQQMGLRDCDRQRVVMIGNNLKKDIAGANRFGLISVWLNWSPRYFHKAEQPDWIPDYEINSPKELPELLKQIEQTCF